MVRVSYVTPMFCVLTADITYVNFTTLAEVTGVSRVIVTLMGSLLAPDALEMPVVVAIIPLTKTVKSVSVAEPLEFSGLNVATTVVG